MSSEPTNIHAEDAHEDTMSRGRIVRVAVILTIITMIEFFFALYLAPHYTSIKAIVNPVYIILTLVKAFFIVAYFMHLKFERIGLIYAIIIPIIFIVGLILVLTNESHHWLGLRS